MLSTALLVSACRRHAPTADHVTTTSTGPSWKGVEITGGPPARTYPAMAFDAARSRVVLFGGNDSGARLDDTWEWNGTAWRAMNPSHHPAARAHHAMAYAAAQKRVVLYGGEPADSSQPLGDTWEWDGVDWKLKKPAHSPGPRWMHAMAYDSARERLVLFGGHGDKNVQFAELGDTWEWDGVDWKQMTPAHHPSNRAAHAMAYDSSRRRVVLFGGEVEHRTDRDANVYFDEMWQWDGVDWTLLGSTAGPGARAEHAIAYDDIRHRLVLYGGITKGGEAAPDDTWEWDGASWAANSRETVEIHNDLTLPGSNPDRPFGHELVFDAARGRVVMFGGEANRPGTDWVWEYF